MTRRTSRPERSFYACALDHGQTGIRRVQHALPVLFYTDVMSRRQTAIYPRMTSETLEALVRRAFRYADGQISFAFQGGEPTLVGLPFFEALMRFERAYNTRGLAVSNAVQTNGYDMPEELLSFFVREGFLIGVSLDGDRAAHDLLRLDRDGAPTYDRCARTWSASGAPARS